MLNVAHLMVYLAHTLPCACSQFNKAQFKESMMQPYLSNIFFTSLEFDLLGLILMWILLFSHILLYKPDMLFGCAKASNKATPLGTVGNYSFDLF
jgi:hypothetical protein